MNEEPTEIRLTREMFMALKPGCWLMTSLSPLEFEEITRPAAQWAHWKRLEGDRVIVFDNKKQCLYRWWDMTKQHIMADWK